LVLVSSAKPLSDRTAEIQAIITALKLVLPPDPYEPEQFSEQEKVSLIPEGPVVGWLCDRN